MEKHNADKYPKVLVPSPTGIAAIDIANIQAAWNEARKLGGATIILQPGTYNLRKESDADVCDGEA